MNNKYIFIVIIVTLYYNVAKAGDVVVKPDVRGKIEDALEDMFIPDGSKGEIGYTYSSIAPANTYFPLGIYGEWAYNWIALSAEIGVNVSNKKYAMPKEENATYDPRFYSMLGIGANFNVLSINFIAGIADYKYSQTTIEGDYMKTRKKLKFVAIMQPSIHVHIPVDDFEHFISVKIGYNICPSMHEFDGLNIGIGFGWWD